MNLGHATYVVWLVAAAGPVVALQWIASPREQRASIRETLGATVAVGTYLSLTDEVAIRDGIWRFSDALTLGIRVGHVPLEEILFFFLSALLVAQSLAIFVPMFERRRRVRSDSSGSPRGPEPSAHEL